jgi:hypothetical protein
MPALQGTRGQVSRGARGVQATGAQVVAGGRYEPSAAGRHGHLADRMPVWFAADASGHRQNRRIVAAGRAGARSAPAGPAPRRRGPRDSPFMEAAAAPSLRHRPAAAAVRCREAATGCRPAREGPVPGRAGRSGTPQRHGVPLPDSWRDRPLLTAALTAILCCRSARVGHHLTNR